MSVPLVRFQCLSIQHWITGHCPRWVVPLGDLGVLAWLAARPSFSQLPHVRLRLLAPKHPPHTLGSLTISLSWSAVQWRSYSPLAKSACFRRPSTNPSICQRTFRLREESCDRAAAHPLRSNGYPARSQDPSGNQPIIKKEQRSPPLTERRPLHRRSPRRNEGSTTQVVETTTQ